MSALSYAIIFMATLIKLKDMSSWHLIKYSDSFACFVRSSDFLHISLPQFIISPDSF